MTYTASSAAKTAAAEVGYRESGTNNTKYNHWFGSIPTYPHSGYGYPWCASFQSWVADHAGGKAGTDFPRVASCEAGVAWFKHKGRFSETPHVGAWVFYGPGGGTHVELVVGVSSSDITTIGGNTSGSLEGHYFNGDGVYRKQVARNSSRIYGYGLPVYDSVPTKPTPAPAPAPQPKPVPSPVPPKPVVPKFPGRLLRYPPLTVGSDVKEWQAQMIHRGWHLGPDGADGKYGKNSKAVCALFQKAHGLAEDGVVGKDTWTKSFS
jgi:hypothetical protein